MDHRSEGETVVSSSFVHDEPFGDEQVIRSLSVRTGVSTAEVRTLFSQEFARLELGAKVLSYLPALTASNVRAMLQSGVLVSAASR
jgi:hypothetical protein